MKNYKLINRITYILSLVFYAKDSSCIFRYLIVCFILHLTHFVAYNMIKLKEGLKMKL